MAAAFWLAMQAVAAPLPAPDGVAPIDFDLSRVAPPLDGPVVPPRCARADDGTIVVCGRRTGEGFPEHWARIFPPEGPLRAETRLAPGTIGRIHTEAVPLDRGAVSNRAMVGVSIAF